MSPNTPPGAPHSHPRQLHILQILLRHQVGGEVKLFFQGTPNWKTSAGVPHLSLPSKTTVDDRPEPFEHGVSLEAFVDLVMREKLGLAENDYVLEQELPAVEETMASPSTGEPTHYTIFPLDVWVAPAARERLAKIAGAAWLSPDDALARPEISPTARIVVQSLRCHDQHCTDTALRMLDHVPDRPSMDGLARKWFGSNKAAGVRVLQRDALNQILDTGSRAFNLRVADPYLRYQQQGVGFTWSFFTHKDKQDTHVHPEPIVEIYGVLDGSMELWWKPYYDRGTSAWNHRVLNAGDWAEVDSLQCHIVHWLTEGKGVVFKAGPGPLAEVGRLGVAGKTRCDDCQCMKPRGVCQLEQENKRP